LKDPKLVPDISEILTITYKNNDSVLVADGADKIEVEARLNNDNVGANRLVTFVTEQGSFVGATGDKKSITVKAEDHIAKVILMSDNVANKAVQLSIGVGDFMIYPKVTFVRSEPEEILLQPGKFTLTPDLTDRVFFNVDLKKGSGSVSEDTKVDFQVQTLSGNPSLFIQPVYWTKSGSNRTELIATSTNTGSVLVTARVNTAQGYVFSEDTIHINVQ
jgi:hypothetical protein